VSSWSTLTAQDSPVTLAEPEAVLAFTLNAALAPGAMLSPVPAALL